MERISALEPDLFACDGFHPNRRAHAIWGEEIAALSIAAGVHTPDGELTPEYGGPDRFELANADRDR